MKLIDRFPLLFIICIFAGGTGAGLIFFKLAFIMAVIWSIRLFWLIFF